MKKFFIEFSRAADERNLGLSELSGFCGERRDLHTGMHQRHGRDKIPAQNRNPSVIFTSDKTHAIFAGGGGSDHRRRYILQTQSLRILRLLFLRAHIRCTGGASREEINFARRHLGRRFRDGLLSAVRNESAKFHSDSSYIRSVYIRLKAGKLFFLVERVPATRMHARAPKNPPGKGIARALIRFAFENMRST